MRRLLLLVLALFMLLTTLRLHGYSLPWWHHVIDGSPAPEVLVGEPRAVRSDDWKVNLPMAFAQRAHEPRFPLVNDDIGLGQNMLAPVAAPVAHPLLLFRPTHWGFFLGNDIGMAWLWWSQALGVFAAFTLTFSILTRGDLALSALGGLLVLWSPFFQLWSLVGTAHASYAALCFVAAHGILRARGRGAITGFGLLLGWASGCFALMLYPPYQIALGYLVLVLLAGTWLAEHHVLPGRENLAWRLAAAAGAATIAVGATLWLVAETREVISLMRHTAYPGQRFSTGGDRSLSELAASALGLPLVTERWGKLLNVCEAAAFLFTFPVVGAALLRDALARRRRDALARQRLDPIAWGLLALCAGLTLYCVAGVPDWLARVTLLGFVPAKRAVIALGIADAALLVRFLACEHGPSRQHPRFALATATVWALLLAAAGHGLRSLVPDLSSAWLVALAVVNGALAFFLLSARRPAYALAALVAASLVSSAWFNPLVRGGSDFLVSNPLSQRILAIDRAAGGSTRWAAFGPEELGDLFRVLGVAAVNGLQPVPQFALWQALDPQPRERTTINRYAHVGMLATDRSTPEFRLVSPDTFFVQLRPTPERLRSLGATHVLVRLTDRESFERLAPLEWLDSFGELHLYRVPDAPVPSR